MIKISVHDYDKANRLILAVCKAYGISEAQLIAKCKKNQLCLIRGTACYASRRKNIHPLVFAEFMHRTRCNIINMARTYQGYIESRDKEIINIYNKILEQYNMIEID